MKIRITLGVLVMGLLASSGGEVYYKLRASDYEATSLPFSGGRRVRQ